jgi:hypothetical protein
MSTFQLRYLCRHVSFWGPCDKPSLGVKYHTAIWKMPVTERCKAYACSRLNARIAGSNPAEGMGVLSLVFVVCWVVSGL